MSERLIAFVQKRGRLEEGAENFLRLLFEHDDLPIEDIAASLSMPIGIAKYHVDVLCALEMIHFIGIAMVTDQGSYGPNWTLLPKGREYVVKNLLR